MAVLKISTMYCPAAAMVARRVAHRKFTLIANPSFNDDPTRLMNWPLLNTVITYCMASRILFPASAAKGASFWASAMAYSTMGRIASLIGVPRVRNTSLIVSLRVENNPLVVLL